MPTFPSKLFPNCEYSSNKDAGFFNITPVGYAHPVRLFLGSETTNDKNAIAKAAEFFDNIHKWDVFCRHYFTNANSSEEDKAEVQEYFDFYLEEVPQVFNTPAPQDLALSQKVNSLVLTAMASHGNGEAQTFVVDFTLGYDQLLCIYFNANGEFKCQAWES